jgi:hypothetical protein
MTSARIAGFAVLALAIATGFACRQQEPPEVPSTTSTPPAAAPAHDHDHAPAAAQPARGTAVAVRYDGPLPPVPAVSFVPPRPPDVVKATYEFAGRRPDVLQYVPCFCGCERSGHVGNDTCFVRSRDASGKPSWDLHGMG